MRAIPFPFAAAIASNVSETVPLGFGSIGAAFEYPPIAPFAVRARSVTERSPPLGLTGFVGPGRMRPSVAAERTRQARSSLASTCSGAMP
ncbi:hypothetical protein GCM10009758_32320 [Microbacterium hatanonis]